MFEKRVNLFGVLVDDISLLRAISLARVSILGGGRRVFFTPNLEMIEGARKSEEIRTLLNSAQVLLPDGVSRRQRAFVCLYDLQKSAAV